MFGKTKHKLLENLNTRHQIVIEIKINASIRLEKTRGKKVETRGKKEERKLPVTTEGT